MTFSHNTRNQADSACRFSAPGLPRRGCFILAAAFAFQGIHAQPEPEEDIFQLPEFVVDASQERGAYHDFDEESTGYEVRFGARYVSERAAEPPWASSAGGFINAIHRGLGERTKAPGPAHTIYDAGMGYRRGWNNLDWRINLNIHNVFNKRQLSAFSDIHKVMGNPCKPVFSCARAMSACLCGLTFDPA